jgi:predicted nucleic acid-binding protein
VSAVVVVDASMALSLVYEDESSVQMEEIVSAARDGALTLLTPAHWHVEIASTLQRGARRRRIAAEARAPSFALLAQLPITIVPELPAATDLFALADEASLSVYDAIYLSLALRERALVATADAALAGSAAKRGILWRPRARRRRS